MAEDSQIEAIVYAHIRHTLRQRDYQWTDSPPLRSPGRICEALETLCQEFKTMFSEQFFGLADRLSLTPAVAEQTFLGVTNELFSEGGVTWSRIVCLFVFSGELAVHFVENGWTDLLNELAVWMISYIRRYLHPWIRDHGGWEGLVTFAHNRKSRHNQNGGWSHLKTLMCTIAAGIVGLSFVGALSSKT